MSTKKDAVARHRQGLNNTANNDFHCLRFALAISAEILFYDRANPDRLRSVGICIFTEEVVTANGIFIGKSIRSVSIAENTADAFLI